MLYIYGLYHTIPFYTMRRRSGMHKMHVCIAGREQVCRLCTTTTECKSGAFSFRHSWCLLGEWKVLWVLNGVCCVFMASRRWVSVLSRSGHRIWKAQPMVDRLNCASVQ